MRERAEPVPHPGPKVTTRVTGAIVPHARHARCLLQTGQSLEAAVVNACEQLGTDAVQANGTATLMGGGFSNCRFTTGGPDRHGDKQSNYTWFREWHETELLIGAVTFGKAKQSPRKGGRFVHCHAWVREASAATFQGGHLISEVCEIAAPIDAWITLFDGLALEQREDPETRHSIFEIAS